MQIICLASSSAGNAYIVKNQDTTFLLEAGIPYPDLLRKLNEHGISMAEVMAVAVTHEHGDHARSASRLSGMMPIIASAKTLMKITERIHRAYPLEEWKEIQIGSFRIRGFYVAHDTDGAMGFIVHDITNNERLLFINDTKTVPYDFRKWHFDYVYIECNHVLEAIEHDPFIKRKSSSHMSLNATKIAFEKAINPKGIKSIHLMHLSDGNSDEERMIREIQELTNVPTYACQKNGGERGLW